MKKKKLSQLFAAITLTIVSSILAKAELKWGNPTTLYYLKGGVCKLLEVVTPSARFTTGGVGIQMTIKSTGGMDLPVFATSTCHPASAVHAHA